MSSGVQWTTCQSTSGITVRPASLAKHPNTWSKDEVRAWLRWCAEEFSIDTIPPEKFDLNGKALCLLSRGDFIERLPTNGDVLYNCLQTLLVKSAGTNLLCSPPQTGVCPNSSTVFTDPRIHLSTVTSDSLTTRVLFLSPTPSVSPTSVPASLTAATALATPSTTSAFSSYTSSSPDFVPRSYIPIKPQPHRRSPGIASLFDQKEGDLLPHGYCDILKRQTNGAVSPREESRSPDSVDSSEPVRRGLSPTIRSLGAFPHQQTDCRLLWEFIYQLLLNTKYSNFVSWENKEEYIFRIANPTGLAELWGQQKNRLNMTYEKLSRALRYYYRMGIIRKVPGKRLTYQFLTSPSNIKKGQRGAKPHCKLQPYVSTNKHCDEDSFDMKPDVYSKENDVTSAGSGIHLKRTVKQERLDSPEQTSSPLKHTQCRNGDETHRSKLQFSPTVPPAHNMFPGSDNFGPRVPRILISDHGDMLDHHGPIAMDLSSRRFSRESHVSVEHRSMGFSDSPATVSQTLSATDLLNRTIKQEDTKSYEGVPFDLSKTNTIIRPRAIFMRSLSFDNLDTHANVSLYGPSIAHARSVSPISHVQSEPEDLSMKTPKRQSIETCKEKSPEVLSTSSDQQEDPKG